MIDATMGTDTPAAGLAPLTGFSLELTARDTAELRRAAPLLPTGARVHVTSLAGDDMHARVTASATVRELGFRPVPHISARRLHSDRELEALLGALDQAGASRSVLVVGGDPAQPEGPYEDSLALIRSGALQRHGVRDVAIAGHPEGHPALAPSVLWGALVAKQAQLRRDRLAGAVLTQFAFDADAVLAWIAQARTRGIDLPIRVGVPGPAGARRLLAYARRFGIGSSATIARRYGLSLTNLTSTSGPDRFIDALGAGLDPAVHGEVRLHFYTFGGVVATAEWIHAFTKGA